MEILLALALAGIFVGPSAYRMYDRYQRRKHPDRARTPLGGTEGRSYLRHLLGMLVPVFIMAFFLALLAIALYYAAGRVPAVS